MTLPSIKQRHADLIERLEKATGPDRELDARIHSAINGYDFLRWDERAELSFFTDPARTLRSSKPRMAGNIRPYTSCVTTALTLIPDGCLWTIEPDACWVRWMGKVGVPERQGVLTGRDGKHTALAICIAALKARKSLLAETDITETGAK